MIRTLLLTAWLAVLHGAVHPLRLAERLDAERARWDDEDGLELVQVVLLAAGLAAATLAVVVIIRSFVLNEANNIPGSTP